MTPAKGCSPGCRGGHYQRNSGEKSEDNTELACGIGLAFCLDQHAVDATFRFRLRETSA